MHCKTDFKDYYDNLLNFDKSDPITYFRFTKEIENIKTNIKIPSDIKYCFYKQNDRFTNNIEPFILGFCGKLYTLFFHSNEYGLSVSNIYSGVIRENNDYKILFSKSVLDYINNVTKLKDYKADSDLKDYNNFICSYNDKEDLSLFREYNTPAFILYNSISNGIYGENIVINPKLNNFYWAKIFNVFDCLQEIEMFIGGVLCNIEKETIMPNNDKILSHGFDLKTSFRKM